VAIKRISVSFTADCSDLARRAKSGTSHKLF
jgi:hypothetical protein